MKKININALTEEERRSPKGKYHKHVKDISIALGRDPKSLDLDKRHPFDLALVRIPPGKFYCPYHAESAQWELYLVVSGRGKVRDSSGTTEVTAGDAFLFKPGEAHQLSCAGEEDFVYYVVADNPLNDSCYYPDSGKWAVLKEGDETVIVKGSETDYFHGEE
ncbi:MAG: cupin domain-containing protein [Chthoniobacterales bacterium]